MELSNTLFAQRSITFAVLPIRLFSSVSKERLLAGHGRAKVDEVLHHLKGEFANRVAWDAAGILTKYVGLPEADGQAKLFA